MRFQRGIHYPHPPRGPARKPYTVSDAARRQRCRNLEGTRLRSNRESLTIKLLIWQLFFDPEPRPSQRALARELDIRHSYVHKVQRKAQTEGMDTLLRHGQRVTLDDVAKARQFTAKLREAGLLAPGPARRLYQGESAASSVMTEDERIAETWREVAEWKRKNTYYGGRRGGWFRW